MAFFACGPFAMLRISPCFFSGALPGQSSSRFVIAAVLSARHLLFVIISETICLRPQLSRDYSRASNPAGMLHFFTFTIAPFAPLGPVRFVQRVRRNTGNVSATPLARRISLTGYKRRSRAFRAPQAFRALRRASPDSPVRPSPVPSDGVYLPPGRSAR